MNSANLENLVNPANLVNPMNPVLLDHAERVRPAAYWELLMNLTRREVKGRYSQSLFGIGWAIAQPLATMAVFTLVFSRLANIVADGVPYPVFAYAGLVPWFFFLNSVNSGTMSLIQYRNIVTKTYFPREIIPLAQVSSRLVDAEPLAVKSGPQVLFERDRIVCHHDVNIGGQLGERFQL